MRQRAAPPPGHSRPGGQLYFQNIHGRMMKRAVLEGMENIFTE